MAVSSNVCEIQGEFRFVQYHNTSSSGFRTSNLPGCALSVPMKSMSMRRGGEQPTCHLYQPPKQIAYGTLHRKMENSRPSSKRVSPNEFEEAGEVPSGVAQTERS